MLDRKKKNGNPAFLESGDYGRTVAKRSTSFLRRSKIGAKILGAVNKVVPAFWGCIGAVPQNSSHVLLTQLRMRLKITYLVYKVYLLVFTI